MATINFCWYHIISSINWRVFLITLDTDMSTLINEVDKRLAVEVTETGAVCGQETLAYQVQNNDLNKFSLSQAIKSL